MKKNFVIPVVISIALVGFLYSRPKVVVKDEAKANRDQVQSKDENSGDKHQDENQAPPLSAAQEKKLTEFKNLLQQKPSDLGTLEKIADVFVEANRFDSAGIYFEKIAQISSSSDHWLRAGDSYFQAYNLALKAENVSKYAEKTRVCYQKVLGINPRQLQAKTNMAMTYVQSDSPMQAIMMLREVITEEPNYEPALMNLGVLSMQSGQYDKAADRFKQVIRLNPNNVNALLGLGYSLIELKDKSNAKIIFEDLKKKVKEPSLMEEVNKALESLK